MFLSSTKFVEKKKRKKQIRIETIKWLDLEQFLGLLTSIPVKLFTLQNCEKKSVD
jgi:hypothetical protein